MSIDLPKTAILFASAFCGTLALADLSITWHDLSPGGVSSGESLTIRGSMGQPEGLGTQTGDTLSVQGGVWSPMSGSQLPEAVQWREEDGGNGHWYATAFCPGFCTWQVSRDAALAIGGDLVSINDADENAFVYSMIVNDDDLWFIYQGVHVGPFIGAYQLGDDEPAGGWQWVDGTTLDEYDAWNSGEPGNDCGGFEEDFANFMGIGDRDPYWNDIADECHNGLPGSIIEWSADCNGDGIVDYGQILSGELEDLDGNGVPDCCDDGSCRVWTVDDDGPADFDNIQDAVDAASDGQTIVVMPGTYTGDGNEILNMLGKAVWLHGLDGETENTIIDGEDARRGIGIFTNETVDCIIEGFTITNCRATACPFDGACDSGGGVAIDDASPTIRNCHFVNNFATWHGGALLAYDSNLLVEDCTFTENSCGDRGGGIYLKFGGPTFTNCTFYKNTGSIGGGGAVGKLNSSFNNCNFIENNGNGGGLYIEDHQGTSFVHLSGCSIQYNNNDGITNTDQTGSLTLEATTVCGNTPSQISGDFIEIGTENYIADLCLPDDSYGACCTVGTCAGSVFEADCTAAGGTWYGDGSLCEDVTCDQYVTVCPGCYYSDIQSAIDAVPEGFTINVEAGTYTGTGENVIELPGHGVSIIGVDGAAVTIIDGEGVRSGLLGDGCGDNGTVIQGLTITNGYASGGGGGIGLIECSPTILDCVISGNITDSDGGGIHCQFCTPSIENCIIENNQCEDQGGGIYTSVLTGAVSVIGCTISGNTAVTSGGGICSVNNSPDLASSIICGNVNDQVVGGYTDGGGNTIRNNCDYWVIDDLFDDNPNADFDNIQAAINRASDGDEIRVMPGTYVSASGNPTVEVVDTLGKSLWLHGIEGERDNTIIDGEGLHRCILVHSGEDDTTLIEGFTIIRGWSSNVGGGVLCEFSSPVIRDLHITDCDTAGYDGSGFGCIEGSNPTLENCLIEGNAGRNGAGACIKNSSPTITNCVITENTAEQDGGGVWCENGSSPSITGCVISGNTAMHGGGTYFDGGSDAAFSECLITGNTANLGGGVCCWNSSPEFTDCFIQDNTATGSDGGGIYCNNSNPSITDCDFFNNTAAERGGAIAAAEYFSSALTGCDFEGNQAASYGGAILLVSNSSLDIEDCTFTGNSATSGSPGKGGAIACGESSLLTLVGCTFDGNEATDSGGALYTSSGSGSVVIDNTLFRDNSAGLGGAVAAHHQGHATLSGSTICSNSAPQLDGDWTDNGGNTIADECVPDSGNGACCILGECSSNLSEQECWDAGGSEWFEGEACIDVTCTPVGACCTVGTCAGSVFESDCNAAGGTWYGDGSLCGDVTCDQYVTVCPECYYTDIQSAIDAVPDGFTINVEAGTYTGTGENVIELPGHGVSIIGVDGAEVTIIDGEEQRRGMLGDGCGDNGTVIQGLTFTNGFADGADGTYDGCGGGISLSCCSPTFIDCIITYNHSTQNGGGVGINGLSCDPTFIRCEMSWNTASGGGGIWIDSGDCGESNGLQPVFDDCFIYKNESTWSGGGVYISFIDTSFIDCRIQSNTTNHSGGGLFMSGSSTEMAGCTITGNATTNGNGGAITSTLSTLEITSSSISNNSAWDGGGLYANESDLSLFDCTVSNNTADSGGGGIYLGDSTATLDECTFTENATVYGGAIYKSNTTLSCTSCTFDSNKADFGGAVEDRSSMTSTYTDCVFTNNIAEGTGGGIYFSYSVTATLTNCVFDGNTAEGDADTGGWGNGGAIRLNTGVSVTLNQCTLNNNTAKGSQSEEARGGGVYWDDDGCTLTLSGTEVCENSPDQIYPAEGWTHNGDNWVNDECLPDPGRGACCIDVECSPNFIEQDCYDAGGSEWFEGEACVEITCTPVGACCTLGTCEDTKTEADCDAAGGTWQGEGSLCVDVTCIPVGACCTVGTCAGPVSEADCDAAGGTWYGDGSLCEDVSCDQYVTVCPGCYYSDIQSAIDAVPDGFTINVGPGTYTGTGADVVDMMGKAITLRATGTAEETILDGQGKRCVVRCDSGEGADTIIEGFTITGGNAALGAGLYCDSSPTIRNCLITGNTADSGGGIYCSDSSPTITDCTITGNEAGSGGGICCWGGSPAVINCEINNNTADVGGGIYCSQNSPTITGCMIEGNTVTLLGGGIYCYQSSPTITECTITGNTAALVGGGISCWDESNPTITDCTISGNTANTDGGGIYCNDNSNPTITDCTISDNAATNGGGIYCQNSSNATLTNTAVCGNTTDQIDGDWADNGGNWVNDECLPDDGNGACCIDAECTSNLAEQECWDAGGSEWFVGEACVEISCTPVGACCIDGECSSNRTEQECWDAGGDAWYEDTPCADVTCIPVGACCLQGTCVDDMYEADCLEDDGVWYLGVDCSDFTCATTFNVPGDFDTIQEAINASGDGFEIVVGPGEYEALHTWSDSVIDLQGKALWLHSSGGSDKTTLDGEGQRRVIDCPRADSGGEIRIEGFTVTGGSLAEGNGAGMRIGPFAEPVVTECVLIGNLTNGYGGAVFIDTNAAPLFEDCSFEYNSAHSGGAVHGSLCEAAFTSCVFSTNYASVDGGAIVCNAQGEMTFHECSFLANDAIGSGGAVYAVAYSDVTINGSTINDNVAGAASGALHAYIYSTISYGSSTFCGNYPADCVAIFGSTCDDLGDNEICPPDDECPGDTNGDGVVGVLDLLAVIDQWGACPDDCSGDFNGDGVVGVTDLLVVLDAWGACEG